MFNESANAIHNDSVLFLVDASLGANGSTEVVRAVLHAVGVTIREWMRKGDNRFEPAVVLYNAKVLTKANANLPHMSSNSYPNVHVIMSFEEPDPDSLLRLIWLGAEIEDCDEESRTLLDGQLKSEPTRGGLEDGLKVAATQFCRLLSRTYKRLVLITSDTDPGGNFDHISAMIRNLLSMDVLVVPLLLSLSTTNEDYTNPAQFWKRIWPPSSNSVSTKSHRIVTSAPEWRTDLLQIVRSKSERKPAQFRGELVLSTLRIGIAGYNLITPPLENRSHYFLPTNTEGEYKKVNSYPSTSSFGHNNGSGDGFLSGRDLTEDQSNALKSITAFPRDIMIVEKFHEIWALPDTLSLRTPMLIVPSNSRLSNSTRAFASLHRMMRKRRKVAEVLFYRSSNPDILRKLPIRGYLFAFDDYSMGMDNTVSSSMHGTCLSSDFGFHFVPIPSYDDIRLNPCRQTNKDVTNILPDMQRLLRKFWSPEKYRPEMFYNPLTHQFSRILERKAFDLGPIDTSSRELEIRDSTLPNYGFIKSHLPSKSVLYSKFLNAKIYAKHTPGSSSILMDLDDSFRKDLLAKHFNVPYITLRLFFYLLVADTPLWDSLARKGMGRDSKESQELLASSWLLNLVQPGVETILRTYRFPQLMDAFVQGACEHDQLLSVRIILKQVVCALHGKELLTNWRSTNTMVRTIFENIKSDEESENSTSDGSQPSPAQSYTHEPSNDPNVTISGQRNSRYDGSTSIPSHMLSVAQNDTYEPTGDFSLASESEMPTSVSGSPVESPSQMETLPEEFEGSLNQHELLPETTPTPTNSNPRRDQEIEETALQDNVPANQGAASSNNVKPSVLKNIFSMMSRFVGTMDPIQGSSQEQPQLTQNPFAPSQFNGISRSSQSPTPPATVESLINEAEQHQQDESMLGSQQSNFPSESSVPQTSRNGSVIPEIDSGSLHANGDTLRESSTEPSDVNRQAFPASASHVTIEPTLIPDEWREALVEGTWPTDLDDLDLVMIGELLGIYNRDISNMRPHITAFLRSKINMQRRDLLQANGGVAKPIAQRVLIENLLDESKLPRKLHDYVEKAFITNDSRSEVTGIMLKTVSRMYGLSSSIPIGEIVSALKDVFKRRSLALSPAPLAPPTDSEPPLEDYDPIPVLSRSERKTRREEAAKRNAEIKLTKRRKLQEKSAGQRSAERAQQNEKEAHEEEQREAERLESDGLEPEGLEAERLEAKNLETEKLETERLETERLETERLQTERLQTENLEPERQGAANLEAERLEAEDLGTKGRQEKLEAETKRLEKQPERRDSEIKEAGTAELQRSDANMENNETRLTQHDVETVPTPDISGATYSSFDGLEKLRLAFTADERMLMSRSVRDDLDHGNLDVLNARQLQVLCKRLKIRNQGKRSDLIDRIKTELDI